MKKYHQIDGQLDLVKSLSKGCFSKYFFFKFHQNGKEGPFDKVLIKIFVRFPIFF